jgi:hypothetical protein
MHVIPVVSYRSLSATVRCQLSSVIRCCPLIGIETKHVEYLYLRVSANVRILLGGPADGESLDIFELPNDEEEEEAHDRVVAAVTYF